MHHGEHLMGLIPAELSKSMLNAKALINTFGPGLLEADQVVCHANLMWQQDQQSNALDPLFLFIQAYGDSFSGAVSALCIL